MPKKPSQSSEKPLGFESTLWAAADKMRNNNEVLDAFNQAITPLFEAMQNNTNQSKTLAELRDTLLPRLMSGEVRVSAL